MLHGRQSCRATLIGVVGAAMAAAYIREGVLTGHGCCNATFGESCVLRGARRVVRVALQHSSTLSPASIVITTSVRRAVRQVSDVQ